MATTSWYNWNQLGRGTQPFYTAFDSLVTQIDLTVSSVGRQFPSTPRTTLVVSVRPTAATSLDTATSLPATWTVVSVAPYGPLRGSFTVVESGLSCRMMLEFYAKAQKPTYQSVASIRAWFRVVGPSFASSTFTGDSSWITYYAASDEYVCPTFSAIQSLGIGTYSTEVQYRGTIGATTGIVMVDTTAIVKLWAHMAPR